MTDSGMRRDWARKYIHTQTTHNLELLSNGISSVFAVRRGVAFSGDDLRNAYYPIVSPVVTRTRLPNVSYLNTYCSLTTSLKADVMAYRCIIRAAVASVKSHDLRPTQHATVYRKLEVYKFMRIPECYPTRNLWIQSTANLTRGFVFGVPQARILSSFSTIDKH